MDDNSRKNPWLGLESYREGEILYGRDDDIRDLTQCVLNDRETLLYGKSGIGKSSILNAGVIPAARRQGYLPIIVRLSHKGDKSYLQQTIGAIARELLKQAPATSGPDATPTLIREIVKCKNPAKETVYEYFHRHEFYSADGERQKLLIIFDQFEEIFTLQTDEAQKKNFFAELADFLNDVMPNSLLPQEAIKEGTQEDVDISDSDIDDLFSGLDLNTDDAIPEYVSDNEIHMVFTIREDFLSEFEYYTSAIPPLKQNRYGLRPISEEQAAQIILRPRPGLISVGVAELIIQKITGRTDFKLDGIPEIEVDSAVLSLYLNRLYDAGKGEPITAHLVEQKGGEIISDFYNEAISGISSHVIEYLEDMLLNGQGRRDNITVFDAINDGHATQEELDTLCNRKKILRQFNYAGDLRIEYIHDILCPVVKAHKDQRIEEQHIKAIEVKAQQERRRTRRRFAWLTATVVLIGACVAAWLYFDWTQNGKEYANYYASFTYKNGWPVGIGMPLDEMARQHTPLYYKLSKRGSMEENYTDVEVCGSMDALPSVPRLLLYGLGGRSYTDSVAEQFATDLSRVKYLHFSAGEENRIERTVALDADGKAIFMLSYFHLQASPNGVAWISFLTPDGQSKELTESGIDRIKLTWDSIGRISSFSYFDAANIRADADGIYGHKIMFDTIYDALSSFTDVSLNEYGLPHIALQHNAISVRTYADSVATVNLRAATDFSLSMTTDSHGVWKRVATADSVLYYTSVDNPQLHACQRIKRDAYGRVTAMTLDNPSAAPQIAPVVALDYAEAGNELVSKVYRHADGKTPWALSPKSTHTYKWGYSNGHRVYEELISATGRQYLYKREQSSGVIRTEQKNSFTGSNYLLRIDSLDNAGREVTAYYDIYGKPVNVGVKVAFFIAMDVHKTVTTRDGDYLTTNYYLCDGKAIKPVPFRLDTVGPPAPVEVSTKREVKDDNGNITRLQLLDEEGNVRKSMMYDYRDGVMVSRSAMGIDGTPVRSPEWEIEGYGYYKMNTVLNDNGALIKFYITNEFNDESTFAYIIGETTRYYKYAFHKDVLADYFVKSPNTPREQLVYRALVRPDYYYTMDSDESLSATKVAYLQIMSTNSPLYRADNRLRDGDRIIGIDNWNYNAQLADFDAAWALLYSFGQHTIKALRPDGANGFETVNCQFSTTKENLPLLQADRCYIYNLANVELESFTSALK